MVKGVDLVGARTLGSMYDHNCIEIMDKDKNTYRIKATEILSLLQKHDFSQTKGRKYYYLSPI